MTQPSGQGLRALFDQGLALYRQGRLEDAESINRQIVELQPDHFDALHLLGVIAARERRTEQAIAWLSRAIAHNSTVALAFRNLGNALRDAGRPDAAIESYDRAIALRAEFHEAHMSRGMVLRSKRQFERALESFDRVIVLNPGDVAAHNARAVVLIDLRRHAEALISCDQAIALAPEVAASWSNRAAALSGLHRHAQALESCDRAIALEPNYVMAHMNRGAVLRELQRHDEALASYDRALELNPNLAEVYANRAVVLQDLERSSDALAHCDRAIELEFNCTLAHVNRGGALHDLMRLDEALASYQRALQLEPDLSRAGFNAGLINLQRGQWEQGWELFERRDKRGPTQRDQAWEQRCWDGSTSLSGAVLFGHWEQGLGDTLQFCRYALLAQRRGARVVLSVQEPLRALLGSLSPDIEIMGAHARPPAFDWQCSLLSLPRAFGTTLATVPAEVPYLQPDPERVSMWRRRIGMEGFKIGVCWQGNSNRSIDSGRSFPLRLLQPAAAIRGVRLISLQKGAGTEQLHDLPQGMAIEELGAEFDAGPDAFLDCAAAMQSLDLVIAPDTSVAHLAGALARPAWVLLQHVPDWRWLLERADSPWYPTLRLFRQSRRGDWQGAFDVLFHSLRRWADPGIT